METDSIVAGLFSDPNTYEMQQLALQRAMNERTAQLTPEQQVTAGLRTAGYQLGQGIGGLMGAQDPQMQMMSIVKQLSSQFDTSTSGGVAGLAQALANRGLQAPALELGKRALEMRKLEAEAQAKTMERLTNEQKNAAGIADASGAIRGTPEWTDTYKTELARLEEFYIRYNVRNGKIIFGRQLINAIDHILIGSVIGGTVSAIGNVKHYGFNDVP